MIGFFSVGQFNKTYKALLGLHERVSIAAGVSDGELVAGAQEESGGREAGIRLLEGLRGVRGLRALQESLAAFSTRVGTVQHP